MSERCNERIVWIPLNPSSIVLIPPEVARTICSLVRMGAELLGSAYTVIGKAWGKVSSQITVIRTKDELIEIDVRLLVLSKLAVLSSPIAVQVLSYWKPEGPC